MKQVIELDRTAALEPAEVPAPSVKQDTVAVRTVASLISVTAERYMLVSAKKKPLQKTKGVRTWRVS
jgi:hypothetical protein